MLSGFSHVMMYVNDVKRAADWYTSILGFKVKMLASPHYGILQHDGMKFRLDLHPARKPTQVGGGPQVYFETDDIDADVAALRGKGVSVDNPRSESGSPRFAGFRDGEGNELGLTEGRG
jgi:catechol 2,3-dioxygenase-like lactoylglutathione lyase family enzyme